MKKKFISLMLALIMSLCLSACSLSSLMAMGMDELLPDFFGGMEKDCALLLKGELDSKYHGEFDADYMKLIDSDRAECRNFYEEGLRAEADFFCYYYDIEYPDEKLMSELMELIKEIYSYADYTVDEVTKLSDEEYVAELAVRPVNIHELANSMWDTYMDSFYLRYEDADIDAMSEEEYIDFDRDWAYSIIDMYRSLLHSTGYKESESLSVKIIKDSDGLWMVDEHDFFNADLAIIPYP